MKRPAFRFVVFVAIVFIVLSQQIASAQLAFEVATVKLQDPRTLRMAGGSCHGKDKTYPPNAGLIPPLGRCLITFSLSSLLAVAYSPEAPAGGISKIIGGPAWVDSDFWLIEGKTENETSATEAELKQMLQTLLATRFKLKFHHEATEVSGFALVVSKNGLKIKVDLAERTNEPLMSGSPAGLTYRKAPLSMFANYLSGPAGGPVVDRTGLVGPFSFTFQPPRPQQLTGSETEPSPSIFTVIDEQLGLRLEPVKVPAHLIVIDYAERPTP